MVGHPHESDRLESLRSYGVLDTAAEAQYDALTALAARICDTPIAAVALVDDDRVWFKSRSGISHTQTPRTTSMCTHVVAAAAPLVVPDATLDPRFADNALVTGPARLRAYAGIPLIGRDGLPLGTLCVLDRRPRAFGPDQLDALSALADQAVTLLEIARIDRGSGRRPTGESGVATDPVRLRAALDDGELVPHFQPIVALTTSRPCGFEALLRWEHPGLGVILPGRFLPAIESSGLILPVGRHVLRESVRLLAGLRRDRCAAFVGVAVNVSLVQLAQPGIAGSVLDELTRQSVPAELLSLELTESAALLDDRVAIRELHALRESGVHLSIDDFGTGYSSLMRLLDLPISTLKLDRSLIQRLPGDRRAMAVARSTLDMAAELDISVVAEGIELVEQQEALLSMGCRYGQGFRFGRAVPAAEVPGVLASNDAGAGAGTPGATVLRDRIAADRAWVPAPRHAAGTEPPAPHQPAPPWTHVVQLYDCATELAAGVTRYLLAALQAPGAALVVAAPARRAAIEEELVRAGVDLAGARRSGRYLAFDPDALLACVLVGGRPDREVFRVMVSSLLDDLYRTHGFVRVYSESVARLWSAGRTAAALEVEALWNEFATQGTFSLYCAYPHEVVGADDEAARRTIRERHTAVLAT